MEIYIHLIGCSFISSAPAMKDMGIHIFGKYVDILFMDFGQVVERIRQIWNRFRNSFVFFVAYSSCRLFYSEDLLGVLAGDLFSF